MRASLFLNWSDDEPACEGGPGHDWELGDRRQVPAGPMVSNFRCQSCGCWRRQYEDKDGTSNRYAVD